jgi:hypothetical protein
VLSAPEAGNSFSFSERNPIVCLLHSIGLAFKQFWLLLSLCATTFKSFKSFKSYRSRWLMLLNLQEVVVVPVPLVVVEPVPLVEVEPVLLGGGGHAAGGGGGRAAAGGADGAAGDGMNLRQYMVQTLEVPEAVADAFIEESGITRFSEFKSFQDEDICLRA